MVELLELDRHLFTFLNGLGTAPWDPFWLFITHKFSAIPLYGLLLYLVWKKYGTKNTLITVLVIALMITCTDQLANLFKYGFERPRPCKVPELQNSIRFVASRCGRFGFFSAHAASSMAAAVFAGITLHTRYKSLLFVLLFWAVLVGYSRIYVGVHYPGDVIIGFAIGGCIGYICYKLQIYVIDKWS